MSKIAKKNPLVSIVVPAFNVAETISETLESLLAQTMTDFELIIVDDGSSDNTLEIANRFDDPRIRIIKQKKPWSCRRA